VSDRPIKQRAGATLPLVAFVLTALLGAAALALDLGLMGLARQRAQNVADAAALAGASAPGAEGTAAASVAAANSAGGSAFRGAATVVNADGSVTVRGYVNAPLSFAPAVGYAPRSTDGAANTLSASARATAALLNVCALPAGMPVAPFGIIGDDPTNPDPVIAAVAALLSGKKTLTPGAPQPVSSQVTLKLNVWDNNGNLAPPGNFVPLLTSGTGATYFDTIPQVSDQALSVGQVLPTAPLAYDNVFYTRQFLAARLSRTNTVYGHQYATYDAWVADPSPLMPDGSHYEDHLLIMPVVSQAVKNKQGNMTVIAFALFFIDQPYPFLAGPAGNGIALGRFVGLTVPGGAGGACAGVGAKTPPTLTQ